jgi:hypothetical protein
MKIRAGSVVLPLHNPPRVALEQSLVDDISCALELPSHSNG